MTYSLTFVERIEGDDEDEEEESKRVRFLFLICLFLVSAFSIAMMTMLSRFLRRNKRMMGQTL